MPALATFTSEVPVPRPTALRATAGCSARASELSYLAPRLPQPAAQSPGDARTCMSSYGGEPGTFVKKTACSEKTLPLKLDHAGKTPPAREEQRLAAPTPGSIGNSFRNGGHSREGVLRSIG